MKKSNNQGMGTFIVKVDRCQGKTWQGKITWADGDEQVNFRSALELVKLMNEAINKISNKKVFDFVNFIKSLKREFENTCITNYIDILINKLNLEEYYKDEPDRLENIKELNSVLAEADEAYEGTDLEKLEELLKYLALRTDEENKFNTDNYVSLMSFHQAKGLEFPVVFMMALEDEIFPSMQAIMEGELEEERRIAYVGITRAKEKLFLSYARNRMLYGKTIYSRPSRFIKEIDTKFLNDLNKPLKTSFKPLFTNEKKEEKKLYTEADYSNDTYRLGDKVSHKLFGDGVIVGMNDRFLTIAFKEGIKQVIKNHPTLSKIE